MKQIAKIIAVILSLPSWLCYSVFVSLIGKEKSFNSLSERISRKPGLLGIYQRQFIYKKTLKSVGHDVYFGYMSLFSKTDAIIGNQVYIGRFCTLGHVNLEDNVMLADGVQILSGAHQHGKPCDNEDGKTHQDQKQIFTQVCIGKGAWIGANAVIMANVGKNAIVGAGAVVTKPVLDNAKVGGVPAKLLGNN